MAEAIEHTVQKVCAENGGLPVIPSGRIIRKVRTYPDFDYKNGGISLCRDGFHMSLVYGRYLLGLVWFKTLLNGNVEDVTFLPNEKDIINGYELGNFDCDHKLIQQLKACMLASPNDFI